MIGSNNPMDDGMDNEQISEELTALMRHMADRGVTRQDGAYLFARLT